MRREQKCHPFRVQDRLRKNKKNGFGVDDGVGVRKRDRVRKGEVARKCELNENFCVISNNWD